MYPLPRQDGYAHNVIFENLNCAFESGGFYFLTGPSGSGKSTFLKLLYGEILPAKGSVELFGENLSQLRRDNLCYVRQKMGLVFQDCRLIGHLSIIDNVAIALTLQKYTLKQARQYAEELLHWVGLKNYLLCYPNMLSQGQMQRVAIARAVVTRPLLLLADEPTGSVDDDNAYRLIHLFEELCKSGTTVLLATHNRKLVRDFSHTEVMIYQGDMFIPEDIRRYA
jgi:cell division transport system ATP-binding protein